MQTLAIARHCRLAHHAQRSATVCGANPKAFAEMALWMDHLSFKVVNVQASIIANAGS
jgi:predicted ArsR family transcriptional regulator